VVNLLFFGYHQENRKELQSRAVAYLNVDLAVAGNYSFYCDGVYSMSNLVFNAAKLVVNPNADELASGRRSVYDTWLKNFPSSRYPSCPV